MKTLKELNSKGFSHIELVVTLIVIAVAGVGAYIFDQNNISQAASDTYTYLGETIQDPVTTAASAALQSAEAILTSDQSAYNSDSAVLTVQESIVQADQTAVNAAATALANAKIAYASGPNAGNPNILARVNTDQAILNSDDAIQSADLAAQATLVTTIENISAKITVDQANVAADATADNIPFTSSDFYSYACQSPGATTGTIDVHVAMIAASYESQMQSGAYTPHAAAQINSTQIIDLGSNWNYSATFSTGTSEDQAGAWLTSTASSLDNLSSTDTVSLGPLPTSSFSIAWGTPFELKSLSDCTVSSTGSSTSTTVSSTKSSSVGTTSITTETTVATGKKTTTNSSVPLTVESEIITKSPVSSSSITSHVVIGTTPAPNLTYSDDTYWFWPSTPLGITEMDSDITPTADGSPDGYYFANQFYFIKASDAYTGYLGLETESGSLTGKIAKFTIWGAISSNSSGYSATSTDAGGTYSTAQIPYSWTTNHHYDLRVSLTNISASTNTWTATVSDQSTGITTTIGNIITPTTIGTLYNQTDSFQERYSGVTASCTNIYKSSVIFSNFSANSGVLTPTSHQTVPPTSTFCNGNYETQDMPEALVNTMWQ